MADSPSQTPADAAMDGQRPPQGGPPFVIKAQYVKDLSFENPRAPVSLGAQVNPQIQVSVNVAAQRLPEGDYEVALGIMVDAKQGAEPMFMTELVYAGVFAIGPVPPEHVRPLLLIEGPRLLFPFARNIVADAIRDGGFPPLLLQPVDFVELYRREIAAQQQGAAPAPPANA